MMRAFVLAAAFLGGTPGGPPPPNIFPDVSISDARVVEPQPGRGLSQAVFTVTLSNTFPENVTVSWSAKDVTATNGVDYVARGGVLTVLANELTAELGVDVLADSEAEGSETFLIRLTSATNARIVDGLGHGVIRDESAPHVKARLDWNGDGRSDVLVQYIPDEGPIHNPYHLIWLMDGTLATAPGSTGPPPSGPPRPSDLPPEAYPLALDDLDHDGTRDALYVDEKGDLWLDDVRLDARPPGQLVGSGDFTSDGTVDFMWWNAERGELSLWESGDPFPLATRVVRGRQGSDPWQPVAVARLTKDADQMPDIVWQNVESGALEYWHMRWQSDFRLLNKELVYAYGGPLSPSLPEPGRQLAGVGDFDGDGFDDLLWYQANRKVTIWFMRAGERRTTAEMPISSDTFDFWDSSESVMQVHWYITGPH